jgi:CorA-like Mg2+ transporter protein
MGRGVSSHEPLRVRPVHATYWTGGRGGDSDAARFKLIEDLSERTNLAPLSDAVHDHYPVWIETYLDGLDTDTRKWFEGRYEVWETMDNPVVEWDAMAAVLASVDLWPEGDTRSDRGEARDRLLRSIPYVFTRGSFGTIRDALSGNGTIEALVDGGPKKLTAFATVGFNPCDDGGDSGDHAYIAIRTVVAVIDWVVITMRLPDFACTARSDANAGQPLEASERLMIPMRFLPLQRIPSPREVAEAIGIHQATTARAVAWQIRKQLNGGEALARQLNPPKTKKTKKERAAETARRPQMHEEVIQATGTAEELADVALQLDRHIAQVLRRFGERSSGAPEPVRDLAPEEVRHRYRFSLEEIQQLHKDCRHSSQVMQQALAIYEESRRARFQFIAALLASIVLIPTLIASIFGVNLGVPAQESNDAFYAFLVTIFLLMVTGGTALGMAQARDWHPRPWEYLLFGGLALAIAFGFALFLRVWA